MIPLEQLTEPPAWKLPPWPAGDTILQTWWEGKKDSAVVFANGGAGHNQRVPEVCALPRLCLSDMVALSLAHCPGRKFQLRSGGPSVSEFMWR